MRKKQKTLALCATGPYHRRPPLYLPPDPPHLLPAPTLLMKCVSFRPLLMPQKRIINLFGFLLNVSVNDLKWIIDLYIFIIGQIRGKACSLLIVI